MSAGGGENRQRDWVAIAVMLFTAANGFVLAYNAFNNNDARQNERLSRLEFILCATDDPSRKLACERLGVR